MTSDQERAIEALSNELAGKAIVCEPYEDYIVAAWGDAEDEGVAISEDGMFDTGGGSAPFPESSLTDLDRWFKSWNERIA